MHVRNSQLRHKGVVCLRTAIAAKVLTCKAPDLSEVTLSGKFFMTGQGMPCLRSYIQSLSHTSQHKYKTWSNTLDKAFMNNTLVAVKVIRYHIYDVHELLRILPDLKVAYYVWHPRGIIASRAAIY